MSYQKQSFGMMDQGYFVPRGQIIDWINNLLDLNITKIQQLGSGAVYCQIVDVIHPGKVSINKVNWKAKNDYEFIANLKILQNAFDKAGVKRHVQVEKLAKAKYQDNLEFIQWLKRYYDLNCGDRGNGYNAAQRRGQSKIDFSFADKNVIPKQFNAKGQIVQATNKNEPPKKNSLYGNVPSSISHNLKVEQKSKSNPKTGKQTNWQLLYQNEKKKSQNLSIQLSMIGEILQSQDKADIKIAMIHETLNSCSKKQNPQMQIENIHNESQEQYNI